MASISQKQIQRLLHDNAKAGDFIYHRRWGEAGKDFQCPRCAHCALPGAAELPFARCRSCRTVSGPLSGTILGKTKVPADNLLWMTWAISTRPGGLSAVEASRETGLSRVTSQRVIRLIRHALAQDERGRQLTGEVEADETFLGGKGRDTNRRGRSEPKKCVLVLAERHQGGRCVLTYTKDAKATTLIPIIKRSVEKGSHIYTDGHRAYGSLGKIGYTHTEHVIQGSGVRAHVLLPAVHQVAKTLKEQLQGTHKRTPKDELLQDYLGSFQWRYNHRDLKPVDAFLEALDVILGVSGGE